ncbi:MAG TPA: small basic family protein [Fimbriimonadaceae bacterium]|nr:small basic family protein [Fimbriimonadaceae bacterium]
MYLIPVFALVLGVIVGAFWSHPLTGAYGQYMAIACLAGLDTICGGIRSGLEGKFHQDIFVTGFFSNIIIAFGLAWLGEKIFVDLYLVGALVLGWRIFNNLSLIRRYLLTRLKDASERRRLNRIAAQTEGAQTAVALGQADTTA